MTSWWRYLYDVIVVLLSLLGAVIALALLRRSHARLHRWFRALAWIAAGLLTLRGVAGLIVDGTDDPIWWPTFLIGGLLFGGVARLSRPDDVQSTPPAQFAH